MGQLCACRLEWLMVRIERIQRPEEKYHGPLVFESV